MKRFLIFGALLAFACGAMAQQRGLVGTFAISPTYLTNLTTGTEVTATAIDLPSVRPYLWVWFTVYGCDTETSQTGLVSCVLAASPDGSTWTTATDTNFVLTATMDGTNKITTLQKLDVSGIRQLKPIVMKNSDNLATVTNISIVYASEK